MNMSLQVLSRRLKAKGGARTSGGTDLVRKLKHIGEQAVQELGGLDQETARWTLDFPVQTEGGLIGKYRPLAVH